MLTAKLHLLLGACFWHLWRSTSSLAFQMMKREVPSPPHPKRAESHSWYEAFPYQFNMDSESIKFLVRHATSHLWIGTPRNELQFVNTGWLQIHLTIKQSPSKKRKHRDCFRQNCNKSWLLRTCHLSTRSFWHSQKIPGQFIATLKILQVPFKKGCHCRLSWAWNRKSYGLLQRLLVDYAGSFTWPWSFSQELPTSKTRPST